MKYGIHVIGYGKRRRYSIVKITASGITPVEGRSYSSLDAAVEAAAALHLAPEKIGDFYKLL